MNILLVSPEYPDTFWSFKHALKFVSKKASNPPLGLLTIATMLPARWNKKLVDLNLQPLTNVDLDWADYVFVSAMDVQRQSVYRVIDQCKTRGKTIIAGGPLFTGEYDRFPGIDHFILNEGEITLPLFLDDLKNGMPQPIYSTEKFVDIHATPVPMWELVDFSGYDSMPIQFSRGCPYNCDFCNVTALLGHQPRIKSVQQIIAELNSLYAHGWRRNIFFVDDNFIGNKRFIKEEILPALINWRKDKVGCFFITEASINLADDETLMQLMAAAGFVSVFIGIETPSEESLAACRKTQNTHRDLIQSVKTIQRHGMQVMGGFIVGFDSDTPAIFQNQIDFIQETGIVTAMVGLLQAPFGTQLYDRMKQEGRLVNEMSGDNTDGTTNILPKMDADLLHRGYHHLLAQIYSPALFYQRIKTFLSVFRPYPLKAHLEYQEWLALIRSIIRLGILGPERKEYWDLFFWTLFKHPAMLPQAITLAIYGYHFRTISQNIRLSAPAPRTTLHAPILARIKIPQIQALNNQYKITRVYLKSMRLSAKAQSEYTRP